LKGLGLMSTALLATDGGSYSRLFGLDTQLIADACITAIAVFVLFIFLSKLLFNPVRDFLEKRQEKITEELETAEKAKKDSLQMKAEYEDKLKNVGKEAESILSDTRRKALLQEREIVEEAKEEAHRIRVRADKDIALEKNKVKDEVKQEMITIASAMAGKIIKTSISAQQQDALIDETLKEMGDSTWQS
jgi:F-type H+-transporting ATPase subunit b